MKDNKDLENLSSTKLNKKDIESVANARFYRAKGIKILIKWTIVLLVIVGLSRVFGIVFEDSSNVITILASCLFFASSLIFINQYSKGQTEVRVNLWQKMEEDQAAKQKELDKNS